MNNSMKNHAIRDMTLSLLVIALFASIGVSAYGQSGDCLLWLKGMNQDRWITGTVQTECTSTPPWGNWGVTSNVGDKHDGFQFPGWKDKGSWRQWNSCTNDFRFPFGSEYYNEGTYFNQQYSNFRDRFSTGPATHGRRAIYRSANCPYDTDGDGECDTGGCSGLSGYRVLGDIWMSLYELDHGVGDDFVTTLYFPSPVDLSLTCDIWGCNMSNRSSWRAPSSSTHPSTGVTAEAAFQVEFGEFLDTNGACEEAVYEGGDPGFECD